MTWTCEMVEYPGDWADLKVGHMFYGPTEEEALAADPKWDTLLRLYSKHLSEYYKENNSHRRPLFVIVPGLAPFCIDGQCFSGERGFYGGWTVTGVEPAITCVPSINLGGTYHGFLQNGVLSPDCEGRTYDGAGYQRRPDVST